MSSFVIPTMIPPVTTRHTYGMSPRADGPLWQQVQTLGVTEVVMAILEARKAMPAATAAAVSREKHGNGFRVRVSLLEGADIPDASTEGPEDPHGIEGAVAVFLARELGKDLADAFGTKDMIILK